MFFLFDFGKTDGFFLLALFLGKLRLLLPLFCFFILPTLLLRRTRIILRNHLVHFVHQFGMVGIFQFDMLQFIHSADVISRAGIAFGVGQGKFQLCESLCHLIATVGEPAAGAEDDKGKGNACDNQDGRDAARFFKSVNLQGRFVRIDALKIVY